MTRNYSIAIDGPAGAGKSTVAKIVANELNFEYIDTGAMYRAYTLKVLQNNLDPKNQDEVNSLLDSTDISFSNNHIYLDNKLVDDEIRDHRISDNVSYIASSKEVRERMVSLQQEMASRKSVVMDGRDITTVVLPDADYKFFVTASVEERGRRRYLELIDKGVDSITLEGIIEDIRRRDEIDSTREESPLTRTEDSILVDTTDLSIEETVDLIINLVKGGK
ncbi:(d)CMP kinase [Gudongella sp. SC589]|uniref:(d)CMP kinase n=1 Tax=Gudongella sp. SC589 TaxID=3385990 RepID=UPI00390490F8